MMADVDEAPFRAKTKANKPGFKRSPFDLHHRFNTLHQSYPLLGLGSSIIRDSAQSPSVIVLNVVSRSCLEFDLTPRLELNC